MLTRIESSSSLHEHVVDLIMQGYNVVMLDPIPQLEEQKGHSCKIVATSNALNFYHASGRLAKKPLKTNKHAESLFFSAPQTISARQVAKQKGITQVGELYHATALKNLVAALGEATQDETVKQANVECKQFAIDQKEEYISYLQTMVDQSSAPVTFFDVDDKGQPRINGNGDREHAALVLGYINQQETGEQYFILGHWGGYYIVDAHELADAAANLQAVRSRETYFKTSMDSFGRHFARWDILNENGVSENERYYPTPDELCKLIPPDRRMAMKHNEVLTIPMLGIKSTKRFGGKDEPPQPGLQLTVYVIHPAPMPKDEEKPSIKLN